MELKLEQKFDVQLFKQKVELLSEPETKEILVQMYQLMIERQVWYQERIKEQWLIGSR